MTSICTFGAQARHRDTAALGVLVRAENNLKNIAPDILGAETDSQRIAAVWQLYRSLDTLLALPASWNYPFDSLRTRTVSILQSPDKKFRLFTFNLVLKNGDFKNFGFIQEKGKREPRVTPLLDTSKRIPDKEITDVELDPADWMGALYYSIVPFKKKGKTKYLLMGFDGSSAHSNRSYLEVLWFDKTGPRFGVPAFRQSENDPSAEYRVLFESHNETRMLLRYEPEYKIVVLDKLTPAFPEATGDFRYYIPSGDYDYYKLNKKGTWVRDDLKNFKLLGKDDVMGPVERPHPEPEPENK
ncbi:MAG: hypothetical protein JNL57_03860 [Bacteroidetes bacterium]|nr:hypothetical protein [Bacteroidota bacterium]